MKQNKYNDEIDKILYEYFKNNVSDEIPSSTKSVINETLKNLEKTDTKKTYINFYKIAVIILCIGIFTTSTITFANDIINFVKSTFNNSTESIDKAVENGYIQKPQTDFVYDKNIGIKIDDILLDNSKLDISYVYDCKNDENIEFIEIKEYTLKDENDNLLYRFDEDNPVTEKPLIINSVSLGNKPIKIDDSTFKGSILYGAEKFPIIQKLIFHIYSLRINNNETLDGTWDLEVTLDDIFSKREIIKYEPVYNEHIISSDITLNASTLEVHIEIDENYSSDTIHMQTPQLYDSLNKKYTFDTCSYENTENSSIYNIKFNTVIYNDNIEILFLELPINSKMNLLIELHQI